MSTARILLSPKPPAGDVMAGPSFEDAVLVNQPPVSEELSFNDALMVNIEVERQESSSDPRRKALLVELLAKTKVNTPKKIVMPSGQSQTFAGNSNGHISAIGIFAPAVNLPQPIIPEKPQPFNFTYATPGQWPL